MRRTVDELLADARRTLRRVSPLEAERAVASGALLVDIRPTELRTRDGVVPGALVIDRNQLEWRLDPAGDHRIPEMTAHDRVVILFCDEGYASSLAAATLQQMGIEHATDIDGGVQAWIRAGLPITRSR